MVLNGFWFNCVFAEILGGEDSSHLQSCTRQLGVNFSGNTKLNQKPFKITNIQSMMNLYTKSWPN